MNRKMEQLKKTDENLKDLFIRLSDYRLCESNFLSAFTFSNELLQKEFLWIKSYPHIVNCTCHRVSERGCVIFVKYIRTTKFNNRHH